MAFGERGIVRAMIAGIVLLCVARIVADLFGGDPRPMYAVEDFAPTKDFVVRPFGLLASNGMTRTATWTLERIDKASLARRAVREGMSFHADPDAVAEFKAAKSDYAQSGYDLGHLACAANHERNATELESTFTVANAMPQAPGLNRGPWKDLEGHLREVARGEGVRALWIITAPAWLPAGHHDVTSEGKRHWVAFYKFEALGVGRVWIPTHCIKSALIEKADGSYEMHSWKMANDSTIDPAFGEHAITTDDAETALGLDLWRALPDRIEDELEAIK